MLLVSPTGVSGTEVDEYNWHAGRGTASFPIVEPNELLKPKPDQHGG
jgi:hypothetical protein